MSYMLGQLTRKEEVDNVIQGTLDKVVVLRFGRETDMTCLKHDDIVRVLLQYLHLHSHSTLSLSLSISYILFLFFLFSLLLSAFVSHCIISYLCYSHVCHLLFFETNPIR